MKWLLIVVIAINVCLHMASAKSVDKGHHHHKKASSAKPTKTPKSIVEQFRGLPADDLAFIEQLDKQFQLHGEKVKIKVERDNTTAAASSGGTGKNSKRTIDGSLSYGYHHNPNHPQHQQFYFSKPRYEIYPYSQEDIPPARHTSYGGKPEGHHQTTVEIQQSQGYEIKEVPQEYPSAYGQHFVRFPGQSGPPPPAHEQVPVIVLKVPGPSKYAAHLKTLLQQYLEIRAVQVIRELEQQEHAAAAQIHAEQYHQQQQHHQQMYREPHRHQQLHHHHQNQELQTHVEYATPASVAAEQHAYQQYQQQINGHTLSTAQTIVEEERPGHAVYGVAPSSPAPEEQHVQYVQEEEYESAPLAGQAVYEDHQTHYVSPQPSQAALIQNQEYYHQQAAFQNEQRHHEEQQQRHQEEQQHQQHQQQLDHDPRTAGHIMYVTAEPHQPEGHQQHFIYPTPSEQPAHHEPLNVHPTMVAVNHHGSQQGSHLETPENYPDEKHTRVVFTKNLAKGIQHHHHHSHHRHQAQQPQMVLVTTQETHHQDDRFHGPIYLPTQAPHEEYGQVEASGHEQQQHHIVEEYQTPQAATPGPFITITQKRKMNRVPFNYHAHGRVSTPPPRKRETPFTEEQFNKFNKLVNRLKKKQMMLLTDRTKKSPTEQEQSALSSSLPSSSSSSSSSSA